MGFDLPLLNRRRRLRGTVAAFSPVTLFGTTDTGWVYDLSDMSTLFQDAAGTTPVTGVGQPVGLHLDKSKGLVLGSELVTNGTFDSGITGWTLSGGTASFSGGIVTLTNVTSRALISQGFSTTPGRTYKISVGSISNGNSGPTAAQIRVLATNSYSGTLLQSFNQNTQNSSSFFTATGSTTFLYLANNTTTVGNFVEFGGPISIRELPGNHRTQSTALNRPTYQVDDNGNYYLSYDGVNDSLATASFAWGTDKATVVAGVRKLSDAAAGIVAERGTSPTAAGVFGVGAATTRGDASRRTWFMSQEADSTDQQAGAAIYASPDTRVFAGIWDRSQSSREDEQKMRLSGVAQSLVYANTNLATGNFGTYQTFFGARGGTSLFFNGREYSNVGINRLLTTQELDDLEAWTAGKTGITL